MNDLAVVVLAAGKGKRMNSGIPKVLHQLRGKPLLGYVLDTALSLNPKMCFVVIGHGGEKIKTAFSELPSITWVEQHEQLGTGHALAQALPFIPNDDIVLVLYGDVPLVRESSLRSIISIANDEYIGLLTMQLLNPTGYGRILRNGDGEVIRIIEEKDAAPEDRLITEVNTGILAARAGILKNSIASIDNNNAQSEYYLTDVIEIAYVYGVDTETVIVSNPNEVQGVNSPEQLAYLESVF